MFAGIVAWQTIAVVARVATCRWKLSPKSTCSSQQSSLTLVPASQVQIGDGEGQEPLAAVLEEHNLSLGVIDQE